MRRAVLMLVLVPALGALPGCPAPPPWEFVSKEHKFKVRFGTEPDVRANAGGLAKSSVYSVESATGALTVTVTDLPIPNDDPPARAELYLANTRDDLIRAALGERTSDASITLAGRYPGREFTARFQQPRPGALRARVYLVGKRLYAVMAIGTEDYVNAPAATAFLKSFMVTE